MGAAVGQAAVVPRAGNGGLNVLQEGIRPSKFGQVMEGQLSV